MLPSAAYVLKSSWSVCAFHRMACPSTAPPAPPPHRLPPCSCNAPSDCAQSFTAVLVQGEGGVGSSLVQHEINESNTQTTAVAAVHPLLKCSAVYKKTQELSQSCTHAVEFPGNKRASAACELHAMT